MLTYDELPQDILLKMMEYQEEQKNKKDASVFKNRGVNAGVGQGGFNWGDTKEGIAFWHDIVDNKKTETFYKRYPKVNYDMCPCKKYPVEIRNCIITRVKEVGKWEYDENKHVSANMVFADTIEGGDFWYEIFTGNLKVFYDKYPTGEFPKKKDEKKSSPDTSSTPDFSRPLTYDTLPQDILIRMLECQEEQGNPRDASAFIDDIAVCKHQKGFDWSRTKEGHDFWDNVIEGNIDLFYSKYPEEDYDSVIIRKLPKEIQYLACKYIKEQDQDKHSNINPLDCSIMGLNWSKTKEGNLFWHDIYIGNLKVFYDRYPNRATIDATHSDIAIDTTIDCSKVLLSSDTTSSDTVGELKTNFNPSGYIIRTDNPFVSSWQCGLINATVSEKPSEKDKFKPIKIKKYY